MKILFTTESYYPIIDGGAIAQHRIVHELIKRGHDVRVIAPGFKFKNTIEKDEGSIIYRPRGLLLPFYMNNKYHFSPFPIMLVRKVIKNFKPDIINVCSPYPISICSILWAKKYNIPLVGSIHILPENILSPFIYSRFYETLKNITWSYLIYFYNLVDQATIPTETGAEMYKNRGLKTQITPISNGVDTEIFKPGKNADYLRERIGLPKKPIVIYTGRINPEKNLDVLIHTIPYVLKEVDTHFLICGSGGQKAEIMDLAKDLDVAQNTTFIDFLDWKDYQNIYALADVFVMPAETELQSISTMEAVASGVPAVVTDKGAVHELVSMGNGFTFKSRNSREMAEKIVQILSDNKLRQTMKNNSQKLIKKHKISNISIQYEKLYQKILDNYKTH